MKYSVVVSTRFKHDYKLIQKQGKDVSKLHTVVERLASGDVLEPQFRDHNLRGKYTGYRECHIEPNWLLIYRYYKEDLILYLTATGSHSSLFDK